MCGIAGIVMFQGKERPLATALRKMSMRMCHRGPDDEGYILARGQGPTVPCRGRDTQSDVPTEGKNYFPKANIGEMLESPASMGLVHRRLSIIDLSPQGHQPMTTEDGRYWLIFNGEIYNYVEVGRELEACGVGLRSGSDTEVLLRAYERWGADCLQKLNGMFAFVIWDSLDRSLFCVRDRIGIKPLYYALNEDRFIFASDIKTLLSSGLVSAEPDPEGLYLAMAFGIAPRPKTAFKGIQALKQAHWMRVHLDGRVEMNRYWDIPTGTQNRSMTEEQAIELVQEKLYDSIKMRLVADVPVGTFMSGGIDSTTISAIAAKLHPGIKAITLAYKGAPELDESAQARATAAMYTMDHIVKTVDPDESLSDLYAWIDGYEEPCHSLSPNDIVSKIARENELTVVLNGLGGDELFGGYSYYRWIGLWQWLHRAPWLTPVAQKFFGGRRGGLRLDVGSASTADRLHTVAFRQNSDQDRCRLFNRQFGDQWDTAEILHKMYVGDREFGDAVEAMNYMDLMSYVGNHHVHRVDQFTMRHSLEGRVPLLDYKLVEAAFTVPSRFKVNGGVHKYVLRKVAERHIAPECLTMKKKGFSLPLKRWMEGPLRPMVDQKIAALKQRGTFNADEIDRWVQGYREGRRPASQVWHLVALELWFERFIEGHVAWAEAA